MWVALSKLQQYQQKVDCDYKDLIANRHPQTTRPKAKWLKAEERKQKCVQDYALHQKKLDYYLQSLNLTYDVTHLFYVH